MCDKQTCSGRKSSRTKGPMITQLHPTRGTFGAFLYQAVKGLVLFDNSRRLGAFESHLGMGLSVSRTDENSTFVEAMLFC